MHEVLLGLLTCAIAAFFTYSVIRVCMVIAEDGAKDEESGATEGEISHVFATAIDNDLNRGGF